MPLHKGAEACEGWFWPLTNLSHIPHMWHYRSQFGESHLSIFQKELEVRVPRPLKTWADSFHQSNRFIRWFESTQLIKRINSGKNACSDLSWILIAPREQSTLFIIQNILKYLVLCIVIRNFAVDFIVNPLSGLRVSPEWIGKTTALG